MNKPTFGFKISDFECLPEQDIQPILKNMTNEEYDALPDVDTFLVNSGFMKMLGAFNHSCVLECCGNHALVFSEAGAKILRRDFEDQTIVSILFAVRSFFQSYKLELVNSEVLGFLVHRSDFQGLIDHIETLLEEN